MQPCPACNRPGIFEHSVLVDLARTDALVCYSRCRSCRALFRRDGPDAFVAVEATTLEAGRTVWTLPPWSSPCDGSAFRMSWDITQAFFEDQAREISWLEPLYHLLLDMRSAGLDARLRAGQSLTALGLSRAREHGLRDDDDRLFLSATVDGLVGVEGSIRGEGVHVAPAPARYQGALRSAVEALTAVPIR